MDEYQPGCSEVVIELPETNSKITWWRSDAQCYESLGNITGTSSFIRLNIDFKDWDKIKSLIYKVFVK